MSALKVLILGNFLFLIIDHFFNFIVAANVYVPLSLLLNIVLILNLKIISYIPRVYALFVLSFLFGLFTSFSLFSLGVFLPIFIKCLWIVTSIFLIHHAVINSDYEVQYQEFESFSISCGYFILTNIILSMIFIDQAYVPNEGFKSLLIAADNQKKLALMIIPFFFISDKKNFYVGSALLIYLLLGTRALMVAALFIFIFIIMSLINTSNTNSKYGKHLAFIMAVIFFVSLYFISSELRSRDLLNFISLIDRFAIWANYISIALQYPLGLGPEGAYYLLRDSGFNNTLDLGYVTQILTSNELATNTNTTAESLIQKRLNVTINKDGGASSESFLIDFICSFGLAGLLLLGHLIYRLVKKFRYALSFTDQKYSVIYLSLGANLIYGFFNSYHSGIFFLIFLYIMLFLKKQDQEDRKILNL